MALTSAGRTLRLLAAGIAIAGLGAGAAYGMSMAGAHALATNVIQACQNPGNGALRVVANNQTDCHASETPLSWNVIGPPGPKGDPGAAGVSPTVTQLAAGDPHCAQGGAAITDGGGSTAYVCSGAPFDGTFTSPNGNFTLRVDDNGVRLGGPGNQTLTISGTGIKVSGQGLVLEGQTDVTLRAGANLDVRADANLGVRAGGTASVRAGASLGLEGSTVTINGAGGCPGVARAGDPVAGGTISVGSSTVCVGG